MSSNSESADGLLAMPKVELHVHMEGAIQPETAMRIAGRNNVTLPVRTLEEFQEWYKFTDFPHFAEVYQVLSSIIQTEQDLYEVAADFMKEQARQNILHTEATFTAQTHFKNTGIPFKAQIDAIQQARDDLAEELGISLLLIIDIPRELSTVQEATETAQWVIDRHGDGLVAALGLGGYEVGFPPEIFKGAFDRAGEAGVPAVIHAGETEGPESIRGAVDALEAVRIGHGVRCLEDRYLQDMLADRQVPLEVCPTSNVCLKVSDSYAEHQIREMDDAGLFLTVNTDDPGIFNTTLTDEYRLLEQHAGFTLPDFKRFNLNAARASLLDEPGREELVKRLSD